MSLLDNTTTPLRHADQFFIGGQWVTPSSGSMIDVTGSSTEKLFFRVTGAQAPDMDRAVGARRSTRVPGRG